jgi:hypothetical protein
VATTYRKIVLKDPFIWVFFLTLKSWFLAIGDIMNIIEWKSVPHGYNGYLGKIRLFKIELFDLRYSLKTFLPGYNPGVCASNSNPLILKNKSEKILHEWLSLTNLKIDHDFVKIT